MYLLCLGVGLFIGVTFGIVLSCLLSANKVIDLEEKVDELTAKNTSLNNQIEYIEKWVKG